MFIGYNRAHKGYLCLSPIGKIYISHHVLFDENVFPFLSYFSPISPTEHDMLYSSPTTPALIPSSTHISSSVVTLDITHPLYASPSLTSYAHSPSSPCIQNNHPMITRGKSGIFKPRTYNTYVSSFFVPTTIKNAIHQPHWYAVMHEEYKVLCANQTWKLTTLPPSIQPIGCKWVFKNKYNPDGTLHKHKARLVAKGFSST